MSFCPTFDENFLTCATVIYGVFRLTLWPPLYESVVYTKVDITMFSKENCPVMEKHLIQDLFPRPPAFTHSSPAPW